VRQDGQTQRDTPWTEWTRTSRWTGHSKTLWHRVKRGGQSGPALHTSGRRFDTVRAHCHLLPERLDYPLYVKGFLLKVSYHSPLAVSAREVTDVLIHHQFRTVVSQLLGDLGALLAKQNQEVLGLLNVGVDPTLRGEGICVHHRANITGSQTPGEPLRRRDYFRRRQFIKATVANLASFRVEDRIEVGAPTAVPTRHRQAVG